VTSAAEPAGTSGGRVLVTGATGGIGQAIVRALAARGARLAVSGRDASKLDALVRGVSSEHAPIALAADLGVTADRDRLVGDAARALGGLDALVYAAGVVRYQELDAITEADLEHQLRVNFVSALWLSKHAADAMQASGTAGAIVHVASTLALRPAKSTLAYAASKAALVSATRSLALELGPRGIRVSCVAPGVIDTDMVRMPRLAPGEPEPHGEARTRRIEAQLRELEALHPLGRLGTPDDVADAAVYLLDAPFVTGELLLVDGGLLLA